MKDTLTQSLLDKDYASLKGNIMKVVNNKISKRIEDKKQEVLNKINGVQSSTE